MNTATASTMSVRKHVLSVAHDFSAIPGARSPEDGPYSGEDFLNYKLRPAFLKAENDRQILYVDLDGVEGYATSFLEAAFGGLARELGIGRVQRGLIVESLVEPTLKDEIGEYIRDAEKNRKKTTAS